MARALEPAAGCEILAAHSRMVFRAGRFTYRITRDGARSLYTVGDGARAISEPILYAFGQGVVGQTYVFEHEGRFFETRVSYFRAIDGLDFTIGHPRTSPRSLEDALGREIASDEVRQCFGCHAPEAVDRARLRLDGFAPGVTCESCHGPGAAHVEAVKIENAADLRILNPGKLNANEISQEFCGSCHLGFEQAMLLPGQGGVNNVRFQGYRIFNSKGHRGGDPRISCVACHDPHEPLERNPSAYDAKCLACHRSSENEPKTDVRGAAACPVSARRCTTCHMPKVALPGMHAEFTDHWIRIARPGDPVPN